MFVVEVAQHSFEISWQDGEFIAKCQQEDGRKYERVMVGAAQSAHNAALGRGQYMPNAGMIEYFTAQEMGVKVDQPEMDWSGDVDY